jgi:hypothetical protein
VLASAVVSFLDTALQCEMMQSFTELKILLERRNVFSRNLRALENSCNLGCVSCIEAIWTLNLILGSDSLGNGKVAEVIFLHQF